MSLRDFTEVDQPEEGQGRRAPPEENEGDGLLRPAGNRRLEPRFSIRDIFGGLSHSVLMHHTGIPYHTDALLLAHLRITELASIFLLPDGGLGLPLETATEPEGASRDADQGHTQHLALGYATAPDEVYGISTFNHLECPELNLPPDNSGHAHLPSGSPPASPNSGQDSLPNASPPPPPPPPSPTRILRDDDRTLPNLSLWRGPGLSNLRPRDRNRHIRCYIMDLLLTGVLQHDVTSLLSQLRLWMNEHPENRGIPLEEDLGTTIGCIYYLVRLLESDMADEAEAEDGGVNSRRSVSSDRHRGRRRNARDNRSNGGGYSNRSGIGNRNRRSRSNRNRGETGRADCEVHDSNIRLSIVTYLRGLATLFFKYAKASYDFNNLLLEQRLMMQRAGAEVPLRHGRTDSCSSS